MAHPLPGAGVGRGHRRQLAQLDTAAERVSRPINGVVFDLGLSSLQLDDPERGFSFQADGPLDMRLDRSDAWSAADLINRESERELRRILKDYGQERWAARIAQRIVNRPHAAEHRHGPVTSTSGHRHLGEMEPADNVAKSRSKAAKASGLAAGLLGMREESL